MDKMVENDEKVKSSAEHIDPDNDNFDEVLRN